MKFTLHRHTALPSTQDEAARLAYNGAPEGTVVVAAEQTAGRGRHGNAWVSPPKGNLYATLLLRPNNPQRYGDFSFIVAVALHRALSSFLPDPGALRIKWPNDLLLNGLKLSGILLESPSPGVLLIGTGVNIAHAPEGRARLNDYAPATIDQVLDAYLMAFSALYDLYGRAGLPVILALYRQNLAGMGEALTIRLPHETFTGRFVDLDGAGALIVETEDGLRRTVTAGEVFFGPNPV